MNGCMSTTVDNRVFDALVHLDDEKTTNGPAKPQPHLSQAI